MKNYAYVMRVRGQLKDYTVTGDAYEVLILSDVQSLALQGVARDSGETLADLEVLAFSYMEAPSCD